MYSHSHLRHSDSHRFCPGGALPRALGLVRGLTVSTEYRTEYSREDPPHAVQN
jgi:hypothetical protein